MSMRDDTLSAGSSAGIASTFMLSAVGDEGAEDGVVEPLLGHDGHDLADVDKVGGLVGADVDLGGGVALLLAAERLAELVQGDGLGAAVDADVALGQDVDREALVALLGDDRLVGGGDVELDVLRDGEARRDHEEDQQQEHHVDHGRHVELGIGGVVDGNAHGSVGLSVGRSVGLTV